MLRDFKAYRWKIENLSFLITYKFSRAQFSSACATLFILHRAYTACP
jgi:hypothetical protein